MPVVIQTLEVMGIGLPVMVGVIVLFMILTMLLLKVFPYKPDEEKAEG